jgi:hypothetical protein
MPTTAAGWRRLLILGEERETVSGGAMGTDTSWLAQTLAF